jgi:trigger factor
MVYEFDVEVRPQFDLPNYKGLQIRRPVKTFTEADVDLEERRLLAPYGQRVPKDGPAELGDYLTVDMTSRLGDQTLGQLTEVQIRIEPRLVLKDAYVDDFGEQVVGVKQGETRTVTATLSQQVAAPVLRGQTAQLTLNVKDVKMLRLPEMTHELMHEFGVHSREQLRERIRVVLNRRLEYQQRRAAREQVLAQIAAASTWELPRDLLIRQARKAFARRVMEMRSDGMPEEEIQAQQRLLEQDTLQSTAASLKEHFVMQKLAEVEKLDVNDDDIEDEIDRMAAMGNESPRRVRARLEKEDLLDTLAAEILERKALDLVLENAVYEDVPLDREADKPVASVEEQAVPGKMHDPANEPPTVQETHPESAEEKATS